MPSDWVEREVSALIEQTTRFINVLADGPKRTAAGLTSAQHTTLQGHNDALTQLHDAKNQAEATYRAAVQAEQSEVEAVKKELRQQGQIAQAAPGMTDTLRAELGLTIAKQTGPGSGAIPTITDLICLPRTNGHNFLDWSGPTGGNITYIIETRLSPASDWEQLNFTTKTAYLHEDAGAGTHREYRVIPRRSDRTGEPSNTVSAY